MKACQKDTASKYLKSTTYTKVWRELETVEMWVNIKVFFSF